MPIGIYRNIVLLFILLQNHRRLNSEEEIVPCESDHKDNNVTHSHCECGEKRIKLLDVSLILFHAKTLETNSESL